MLKKELEKEVARLKSLVAKKEVENLNLSYASDQQEKDITDLTKDRDTVNTALASLKKDVQEHVESSRLVRERGIELKDENTRLRERMSIINNMTFCV